MSDIIGKIVGFISGKDIDEKSNKINNQYKSLCERFNEENKRLRADLAAVTAERDRVCEALKPFDDHEIIERVAEALYVFVEAAPGNSRDFRGQARRVLAYVYPRIIAKYCDALDGEPEKKNG